jgi:RHS repeat-associated protein
MMGWTGVAGQWDVCRSTGTGFVCGIQNAHGGGPTNNVTGDFNGDGKADVMGYTGVGGQWDVCLSTGTGFTCGIQNAHGGGATNNIVGDFNGDGKTDLAAYTSSGTTWQVCLSTGAGFVCDMPSVNWRGVSETISGDFNGDGRTDLITLADNGIDWLVCYGLYSSGTSFSCVTLASNIWAQGGAVRGTVRVGDFNGDGLADLANYYAEPQYAGPESSESSSTTETTGTTGDATEPEGGAGVQTTYFAFLDVGLANALFPDLVTKVTNGLGHETTISYLPLTNSTVYTKHASPAVYPDVDLQVPLYVVRSASIANAIGGTIATDYTYGGARANYDGRGFLGFGWREATAQASGIKQRADFRQDWPFTGMASRIQKIKPDGTVLVDTVTTPDCKVLPSSPCTVAPGQRYLAFADTSDVTTRDWSGTFLTKVRSISHAADFDEWGNALRLEMQYLNSDDSQTGYSKITTSTYTNNTTDWILGRLSTAQVQSYMPNPPPLGDTLRKTYFDYEATTGLLLREIMEPYSKNPCLVTVHAYDNYGNRKTATTRNCNGTSPEAAAPTGDYVFAQRVTSTGWASDSGGTDTKGRFPTKVTNALGHIETRSYSDGARFGVPNSITGPNNLTTTWTYDNFGRKALETRADGNKTEWTYTACGTCPTNAKYFVTIQPKNSSNVINGAITKVYYDALNREIRSEVEGFDGTLVFKDTEYDSRGRVLRVSRPYYNGQTAYWTTYEYDDLDRVTMETQPTAGANTLRKQIWYIGFVTTQELSNNGTTTNMPAASTQIRKVTRNSQGQIAQVEDENSNLLSFSYYPFGELYTANAAGAVTTFEYSARGFKTKMIDPDMGTWTYVHDPLGQLKKQTDAKGQIVTMTYDLLGRMTSRTEPDLVSNWYFDTLDGTQTGTTCGSGGGTSKGSLCKATTSTGYTRQFTYDNKLRVWKIDTTISATLYNVTYTYNADGRHELTTYPEGLVTKNRYNARGYLEKVTNNVEPATRTHWQANSLTASGKVLSETTGIIASWTGNIATRTYDALDRMQSVQVSVSSGQGQHFTYGHDAVGNMTQRVDVVQGNLTEASSYSKRNELGGWSGTGFTTHSVSYEAKGNISYKSDVGTYSYNAQGTPCAGGAGGGPHAVCSITGTVNGYTNPTFTYDANGNMLSGVGRTYTWTSFNMPLHIEGRKHSSGAFVTLDYNYNDAHERVRLIHSTLGTITYLHPSGAGSLLYEKRERLDGVTEHTNYISAGGRVIGYHRSFSDGTPSHYRYLQQDHQTSIASVISGGGAVNERLAYEPFGKRRNVTGADDPNNTLDSTNTDRGYTSHEHLDEVALIHMNGRVYDPVLARFISADPFVQFPNYLISYNRYAYVFNNPLGSIDPSGYMSGEAWAVVAIIAAEVLYRADVINKNEARAVQAIAVAYLVGGSPTNGYAGGIFGAQAPFANALAGGFAGGVVGSGTLEGGVHGAFSGALFYGAGSFAGYMGWARGSAGSVFAHAAAGCISASASGGKCGEGASSAGFSELANPYIKGSPGTQLVAHAVIGGTAAAIGGGKFSNGAVTASFAYLYGGTTGESAASGASTPSVYSETELANIIYNETAGFRGDDGALLEARMAVGYVAVNRVEAGIQETYGRTIASYQLSAAESAAIANAVPSAVNAYESSRTAAAFVLANPGLDPTLGSTAFNMRATPSLRLRHNQFPVLLQFGPFDCLCRWRYINVYDTRRVR